MVSTSFVLCDVFAELPFAGNPLAVFLDADGVSDATMADLAREFGWSEITFVVNFFSPNHPRVRIWTPRGELPFAGHPVLGTAVVLAARNRTADRFLLELDSGLVAVDVTDLNARGGRATMVQQRPEFGEMFHDRLTLAMSLGLRETDLAPDLPAQMVSTGTAHFLVPVCTLDALRRATVSAQYFPGIINTMGARWAYVFSVEAPETGVAARARLLDVGREDSATGSAAGPLGAYLVAYGLLRAGELTIEQGIEMGRPSRITVDVVREDGEMGPIRVSGNTRIWGAGEVEVSEPSSRTLGL